MTRVVATKAKRQRALPYSDWRLNLVPEVSLLKNNGIHFGFSWAVHFASFAIQVEAQAWIWILRINWWAQVKP